MAMGLSWFAWPTARKAFGRPMARGDIGVRAGFAVRNAQQRLPAIFLELCPNQVEFKRESAQFTAKVAFELRNVRPQMFG